MASTCVKSCCGAAGLASLSAGMLRRRLSEHFFTCREIAVSANIETIAQMVGCSIATVSRVINNTDSVSNHLRQAILQAMREVNYVPRKRQAQRGDVHGGRPALRARPAAEAEARPALVDVLLHWRGALEHYSFPGGRINVDFVDDCADYTALQNTERIANSFFRTIIDGICAELTEWGYRPVLQMVTDLQDARRLQALYDQPLDGVIVTGQPDELLTSFLDGFRQPVVLADVPTGGRYPWVTVDNRLGMELAFDHLYESGHRKIGFLLGPQGNPVYAERYAHFCYHMVRCGLEIRPEWVYRGFTQVSAAAAWARPLLQTGDIPTAFLSSNDLVALGVLRAAAEAGVAVPRRLSLVGYDDIDAAAVVTPALTSVRVPTFELGRESARQLVLQMGAKRSLPIAPRVVLPPELILRSSTAPVAG